MERVEVQLNLLFFHPNFVSLVGTTNSSAVEIVDFFEKCRQTFLTF